MTRGVRFSRRQAPAPALALLATVQFLLVLDGAVVSVALPSIQDDLNIAAPQLPWVVNAYAVAFGGFLLVGGRLSDLLGSLRTLVGGAAVFCIASVLGGVATSGEAVILSRAAQGLAAAAMSPALLALIVELFPDGDGDAKARRNRAFGIFGAAAAAGGAGGYLLGGALTTLLGWRSIFLLNVLFGLAVLLSAWRTFPRTRRPAHAGGLDLGGAVALIGAIALLVYAILEAGQVGVLSPRPMLALPGAALALGAFVAMQRVRVHPLVPPSVLRNRPVLGANLISLLVNMSIGPLILVMSLYAQDVLGLAPFAAGLAILPLALATTVASSRADAVIRRFGLRRATVGGLIGFAAGVLWFSRISGGTYLTELLGPALLVGVSGGIVFVAFTVTATTYVDESNAGLAGGLLGTSHQVGSAIGFAIVSAVAAAVTDRHGLTDGYRAGLLVAVVPVLVAVLVAIRSMPSGLGGRSTVDLSEPQEGQV